MRDVWFNSIVRAMFVCMWCVARTFSFPTAVCARARIHNHNQRKAVEHALLLCCSFGAWFPVKNKPRRAQRFIRRSALVHAALCFWLSDVDRINRIIFGLLLFFFFWFSLAVDFDRGSSKHKISYATCFPREIPIHKAAN